MQRYAPPPRHRQCDNAYISIVVVVVSHRLRMSSLTTSADSEIDRNLQDESFNWWSASFSLPLFDSSYTLNDDAWTSLVQQGPSAPPSDGHFDQELPDESFDDWSSACLSLPSSNSSYTLDDNDAVWTSLVQNSHVDSHLPSSPPPIIRASTAPPPLSPFVNAAPGRRIHPPSSPPIGWTCVNNNNNHGHAPIVPAAGGEGGGGSRPCASKPIVNNTPSVHISPPAEPHRQPIGDGTQYSQSPAAARHTQPPQVCEFHVYTSAMMAEVYDGMCRGSANGNFVFQRELDRLRMKAEAEGYL
ncbi:hypothetical protein TI39_contig670g00001 [Zymoseptoria brevis]|uniref:Uncharacterized protein n=1 Tax=Zymoseptoria brevis TaxID=1047168 RepID=A0A0F4GJH0_9PEZI|nr:hypothetical protein TI39_contig670g00001 [Zymoseptoria brevis]